MGLSLAMSVPGLSPGERSRVVFITAGTFAAMSVYGYTTQRDLSQFGSFALPGSDRHHHRVTGSHVFFASSALQFAKSDRGRRHHRS